MPLTIQQVNTHALSLLNKEFEKAYGIQYHMKYNYGKYKIYKSEYSENLQRRTTITLASGLDRATAKGMMKLLEEPK